MKTSGFPRAINQTQQKFYELCELGGGSKGGPARSKVQNLLRDAGRTLNNFAYDEVAEQQKAFSERNPWHLCYAIGLSWGHLAKLDLTFSEAAINLLERWNDDDLKTARKFGYERGPEPIEQSLSGGSVLFSKVTLPARLPDTIEGLARAQDRWLSPIIRPDRPKYIGAWNATALFMVALLSQPALAKSYRELKVMLPPGGPIYGALSLLHKTHLLDKGPDGGPLDEAAFEPGVIYSNNALFKDLLKGSADLSLIDLHSGLYMLGSRLESSRQWE